MEKTDFVLKVSVVNLNMWQAGVLSNPEARFNLDQQGLNLEYTIKDGHNI